MSKAEQRNIDAEGGANSTPQACVLLVDDDVTFLYALSEGLRVRLPSVNAVTCNEADKALRKIEKNDYDAIVTKVKMPCIDGQDLLVTIRERRPETPLLLLTRYQEYRIAVQALRSGAYDLIQKPIDWEYFINSLSSAIQRRQMKRLLWRNTTKQESLFNNQTLLAGIKVLVVDDDNDGRSFQEIALKGNGASVLAVDSVRAALEVLEQFDPDILVSDIRMPLLDGYSLVRKLRRSTSSSQDIPAIAVTAYSDEEELAQALRAGFQLQISKPVEPIVLVLAVATLTGRIKTL